MSKTFVYALLVIGVYVVIIFPKLYAKKTTNNEVEKEETTEEKSSIVDRELSIKAGFTV